MIEIVAGRFDAHEVMRMERECIEAISVALTQLAEIYRVLPTPGISDKEIIFVGHVDPSTVLQHA